MFLQQISKPSEVVPVADGALQRQIRKEVELQLLCHEHQNILKLVSMFQVGLLNGVVLNRVLIEGLLYTTFHVYRR